MFKFYAIQPEILKDYAGTILQKEGKSLPEGVADLIIKESKGQVRDMLKLLQVAAEQNLNTIEKLEKFLALPDIRGMGAFLSAVLGGNSKLAVKVLTDLNTDLIEWRDRLEQLIYELLEDVYGIRPLPYSESQTSKLRSLTSLYSLEKFGKILDYLLKVNRADTAYQLLYVLAVLGVDNVA